MAERPVCTKTFQLNNGYQFPAVGLGTWQGRPGTDDDSALEQSVVHALRSGYRLIDTAQLYGVEHVVGRAIRSSGVPRSDIAVVTKFWGQWHHDPAAALRISLDALGLDYIDAFLMHWPWATTPDPDRKPVGPRQNPTIVETWHKMEALVGPACRSIGVSNFSQKLLDELLASARVVPAINQVELHAFNPNLRLVPYCQSKGIHVMSCTMGGDRHGAPNEILTNKLFTDIAHAHSCSAGVVSLSWAVQRGITVIPKSGNKARIEDNIRLVTLADDEMAALNNAHKSIKRERLSDRIQSIWIETDGKKTMQGWTNADLGYEDEQGNWLM